ncbi:protein-L-isoaspartate O-methyltransferase-domain-containing protein [Xylariaceae sp. FL1019]|nr:protein-L-isoaspartate O-methyltransferase-domain-containing protein [Xylariaceae sp. FL1019]
MPTTTPHRINRKSTYRDIKRIISISLHSYSTSRTHHRIKLLSPNPTLHSLSNQHPHPHPRISTLTHLRIPHAAANTDESLHLTDHPTANPPPKSALQNFTTMAWRSSGSSNETLVTNLYTNGLITSPAVRDAFLAVDRGHYAPGSPYEDSPQPIGCAATISAPHMHASAVEALLPFLLPPSSPKYGSGRPRRVLDIGSGSGYLTHILAELAGKDSVVVGVEHIRWLWTLGQKNMGKSAEGQALLDSGRVRFRLGDGRKGWVEPLTPASSSEPGEVTDTNNVGGSAEESDEQGWDAIHVGAAAVKLHDALVQQLRSPGRLFIPVEEENQHWRQFIWVVDKDPEGNVSKKKMYGVRYVPLTDSPSEKDGVM